MNLSAIAVKRPVFTVMVTLALLVLGGVGLSRLGTELFPDISFPVVSVSNKLPSMGAPAASVTLADMLLICPETDTQTKREINRRTMDFMTLD